jgi:hypothetical protein
VGDAGKPRKLHKSLPMIRRDSGVQLCEATDEDRQAGDELEVAHGEHGLSESAVQSECMDMTLRG